METVEREAKAACLKAAKLIDRKGWVQGKFQDDSGAFCMDGALADVCLLDPHGGPRSVSDREWRVYACARDLIERVLSGLRCGAPGSVGLVRYNDEPGRTQAEVDAVLREAAHTPETTPNPAGDE